MVWLYEVFVVSLQQIFKNIKTMTKEEIKQAVEDYFNEMFAEDADYLDHITDSWIYDAENWFLDILEKQHGIKIFVDNEECDEYTPEVDGLVDEFWGIALPRHDELYDEKYGNRDAKHCLRGIKNDVKTLLEKYNSVKHHFKTFNAYTEAVTHQFEELEKYLQLLDDIENGKNESLKKGE